MLRKLLHHLLPGVIRPMHILWNQVIGFFFLVLAIVPVPSAIRSLHDPNGLPRFILSVIFVIVMGTFAVTSFLRARKISRAPAPAPYPTRNMR